MNLIQRIELLHRSSQRMMEHLEKPESQRDVLWWKFLQRETWVHLKRSLETWWALKWMKKGKK
jgi:hypothetical protein